MSREEIYNKIVADSMKEFIANSLDYRKCEPTESQMDMFRRKSNILAVKTTNEVYKAQLC